MNRLAALLQRLIATPSVNPSLPGAPDILGEHRMAETLEILLAEKGFRVARVETLPGRPSVIASFGCATPSRTLMIEGHLDTVGVEGMTVPPFAGEIRDGRMVGRGACDMKGPMAAALDAMDDEVLRAFAASGRRLMFVGAIDEEVGAMGARLLARDGTGADEAVILEPTGGQIVIAHKTPAWMFITLHGTAGHGSRPEKGVNAIDAAVELLPLLHAWHRELQPAVPHPLLGGNTMSIGTLHAGSAANVIPDRCDIQIDRRVRPGDGPEGMRARVCACLEQMKARGRITGYSYSDYGDYPSFLASSDGPLVRRLARACRESGLEPVLAGTPWFSDAGAFRSTCGDLAVFGPGDIAQAHTRDEYISLAELERGRAILKALMLDFAGARENPRP